MADRRDDPEVFWVEPRKRAIIPLEDFHCSRSLAKLLRRDKYQVTCNEAFAQVMDACAAPRPDHPESWISERITASYNALHLAGYAHSIECWEDGELAGGLYGVGFGRVFCGESMFSRSRDASKVALAWLVASMKRAGCTLLDCQFMTSHLASLGAIEISQSEYLERLTEARAPLPASGDNSDEYTGEARGDLVPLGHRALQSDADGDGASSPGKLIAQSFTQTS